MLAECLNANAPEPYVLLGQRLKPFTLGHAIWLHRLEIAEPKALYELLCAVYVCCHPPDRVQRALESRWLRWKIAIWRFRLGKVSIKEKLAMWREYTELHPPHIHRQTESDSRVSGAPFLQHLKTTLTSRLGFSLTEALNCPINQALWDYWTYWESEGECQIVMENSDEMFELANQIQAELDARQKGQTAKNN